MSIQYDVKDLNLADDEREAIEWGDQHMPVMRLIRGRYMMTNAKSLEKKVYNVLLPIDEGIARLKLHSMGISIDLLAAKQEKYLASWEKGA